MEEDYEVPFEGIPLVIVHTSKNESKLVIDKGNVKPEDKARFNISKASPKPKPIIPETQLDSTLARKNNKLMTLPNNKINKKNF